jgi:polyhydroxyalkanoate synthesis repressor PhaR
MKPNKVVIKKYENRRLYDTTNSRYVNLDEVAGMLREGTEVQALDSTTGEDITRLVLTQIIVEGAKDRDSALPLDMLRQMVIATGKASQEGFAKYMKAMLEMYQNAYRAFPSAMSPFDFMQMMMSPGGRAAGAGAAPTPGPQATDTAPEPAGTREDESEVKELRRRIDEMERLIASSSRTRSKRTRKRRKTAG